jgi:hypothetical protein
LYLASDEAIVLIPQPVKKFGPNSCSATAAALSFCDDAGEQQLTGIGRPHSARTLLAVERQGVGSDVVAPERLFEPNPEILGLAVKLGGAFCESAGGGHLCAKALRSVDVTLHLAERDRAFGALLSSTLELSRSGRCPSTRRRRSERKRVSL